MHRVPVRDIMKTPVYTIHPEELAADAAAVMEHHGIRRLPVVDDEGYLVGIVTDTDVLEAETAGSVLSSYEPGVEEQWLSVSDVMTPEPEVISVEPDATVGELVLLLMEHKIGGLPVVEPDPNAPRRRRVVGIVSETDIFRMIAEAWQEEVKEKNLDQ
jgi:CBS domain-containing protein